MDSSRGRRVAPQSLVLVLAAVLFAILGAPAIHRLLFCYAAAWVAVNLAAAFFPSLLEVRLGRAQRLVAGVLFAALFVGSLLGRGEALVEGEALATAASMSRDRLRLEDTPSIAPPLVRTDEPQRFYVYAPGAGEVSVLLDERVRKLAGVSLGEGLFRVRYDPREDGVPGDGALVAGEVTATLLVDGDRVSRTLRAVRARAHPRGLRASPDGLLLATVSRETDELVVLRSNGLEARVPVGDAPSDAGFVAARRVVVSHGVGRDLLFVDVGGEGERARVNLGPGQRHLAVSPSGRQVAVTLLGSRRGVALVDVAGLREEAFVPLDGEPDWVSFGPDEETLLVTTRRPAAALRLRTDASGGLRVDGPPLPLARPAVTLARAPDGAAMRLAVTGYTSGGRAHLGNHYVQDQILSLDLRTLRVRDAQLTARRSPRQGSAGNVDRGVSPMGLDPRPDGALRVAFAGTDEVWLLRPARARPRVTTLPADVLPAPHGVGTFADGRFAVTSPSEGAIGIFDGGGELSHLIRLEPDDRTLLEEDPGALQRRLGEHGFYEATRSGISCQSCHMHRGTDGVLRNIGGHRLAPTLTVAGVLGTAPYLRDGSYPRIRDLDHLSQTLLRGYLRRAPARGQNLEAYVESLARPTPEAAFQADDLPRDRNGVAAFVKARCATCHRFPAFTNLGQHPLSVLFPDQIGRLPADDVLDTPSLLSVGAHPPYLSDGRAPTLEAVLRKYNPSGRHGHADALTEKELGDLVGFLSRL